MGLFTCGECKRQEIHLAGKPGLGGKQSHLPKWLISGIFFSQSTPEPRYRGDVQESQRSQTGTEPGRCSDQTYPHSEQGRSSLDSMKTLKPQTWRTILLHQIQNLHFKLCSTHQAKEIIKKYFIRTVEVRIALIPPPRTSCSAVTWRANVLR